MARILWIFVWKSRVTSKLIRLELIAEGISRVTLMYCNLQIKNGFA